MSKEILAESSISLNSLLEYSHVDTGATAPTNPVEGDVWYETDDDGNTKSIKQYSVTEDQYIQQTESSTYDSSATYYTKGDDGTYSVVTITEEEFNADKTQYYILESGTASWTNIPLTGSVLANNTITNTQLTDNCVRVPNLAIGQYMNFYDAPMIIMGGERSDYKLAISNQSGLGFYYGVKDQDIISNPSNNRVAYINTDQLYINKVVVVVGMQIGTDTDNYVWNTKTNSDGKPVLELRYSHIEKGDN